MGQNIVEAVRGGFLDVAHRGARSLAPENTLIAGRRAFDSGARMWEIDVRMSRDGELVVIHDATLERTSDVKERFPGRMPWNVHDFTLDELKSLNFGSWFETEDPFRQISAGMVSRAELDRYSSVRMPTLREALEFTLGNDWLVNIEIKDLEDGAWHNEIAELTARLVCSMSAAGSVILSSFNPDYLARVKKTDKNLRTGVLVDHIPEDPGVLMRSLDAFTFHPALQDFPTETVRRLVDSGFGVLVWVVNDEDTAGKLMRSGVSGMFTDFPQNMHAVVERERRRLADAERNH